MIFLRNESLGSGVAVGKNTMDLPLHSDLIGTNGFVAQPIGAEIHEEGGLRTMNNQAAFIPQTTDLDIGTGSIHFGCTFKIKGLSSNSSGLLGKSVFGNVVGRYHIRVNSSTILFFVQDSANMQVEASITPYNNNEFHKVEGVFDRTRGFMSLIVDGTQVGHETIPISSNNVSCNAKFHIGAFGTLTGSAPQVNSFFNGIIKDVFFNKF